ncbi:hypothetical protein KFE98_19960 [bacterium SCSIO 12741]|nr:hypothetical protein KFE98_19960 [bacterium SCSIO 12741]
MKKTIAFHLFLLLILGSCSESAPQKETPTPPQQSLAPPVSDSVREVNVPLEEPEFKVSEEEMDDDYALLICGMLHQEELPENWKEEGWVALLKVEGNHVLRMAHLQVDSVHDPLVDEEDQKTGWQVQTDTKDDDCHILIRGLLLREKYLDPIWEKVGYVLPGDTLVQEYKGKTYRLTAEGKLVEPSAELDWYGWERYRLFLERQSDEGWQKDTLVQIPDFNEAMVTILFAGDLDGDGELDLILDKTFHYNLYNPALYLSIEAPQGKLLKLVAQHESVGC